jgi:hypothetical protein
VVASVRGGARQLWVTPNHLMTEAHWEFLGRALTEKHDDLSVRTDAHPIQSAGVAGASSR